MYGDRLLTPKRDTEEQTLKFTPSPGFIKIVIIWLQFYSKIQSYSQETLQVTCSNPFVLQMRLWKLRKMKPTANEWQSWVKTPSFLTLGAEDLGKPFRRPNTGLTCGINVHLSHGICYLQLCFCYGICCSVFWLCTWFAILGHSNMLPQSTEQWSVNWMAHTVICELNCYSST